AGGRRLFDPVEEVVPQVSVFLPFKSQMVLQRGTKVPDVVPVQTIHAADDPVRDLLRLRISRHVVAQIVRRAGISSDLENPLDLLDRPSLDRGHHLPQNRIPLPADLLGRIVEIFGEVGVEVVDDRTDRTLMEGDGISLLVDAPFPDVVAIDEVAPSGLHLPPLSIVEDLVGAEVAESPEVGLPNRLAVVLRVVVERIKGMTA